MVQHLNLTTNKMSSHHQIKTDMELIEVTGTWKKDITLLDSMPFPKTNPIHDIDW